eukprot:10426858-Karenia_brevis.AAC.1
MASYRERGNQKPKSKGAGKSTAAEGAQWFKLLTKTENRAYPDVVGHCLTTGGNQPEDYYTLESVQEWLQADEDELMARPAMGWTINASSVQAGGE